MALTVGSLCTGIGGLDLAVSEFFGAEVRWHCDFDTAPSKVLEHHYPDVPNHGDLKMTDWAQVATVDIVTAGYPCQPFSAAGRRKGNNDERHLWPAIRDAIGVLRPRVVVLENVRGHLSLGFADVLADLSCLGFDAEWGCFRSSDIGAPHRRERLYVVATSADSDGIGGLGSRRDTGRRAKLEDSDRAATLWRGYGPAVALWEKIIGKAAPEPLDDAGRLNQALVEWMMGYPAGWVTDGAIGLSRAQQLKVLGNAVQPQPAALALSELWR